MQEKVPIETVHLFPVLDEKLLQLLHSLKPDEWNQPTIAKKWKVRDVAAHLLDGNIRGISVLRDQHISRPAIPPEDYRELVVYLNELNDEWVKAARRMSSQLLVDLLRITGHEYCKLVASLPAFEKAVFPVAWAGENVSRNWFHIAREYTEKFIHQQQIRDATGREDLFQRELFYPFLDTILQGLPYTYRNVNAVPETSVQINITSEAGGKWWLTKKEKDWKLSQIDPGTVSATISIDPDTAWKLFSKGMDPETARDRTRITGEESLAVVTLQMISVMA